MAVTANRERITMNHLGGEDYIVVTYEGGGTYKEPRIVYTQGGSGWITVTMQGEARQDVVYYKITLPAYISGYQFGYVRKGYIVFYDEDGDILIPVNQSNGYWGIGTDIWYRYGAELDQSYEYVIKRHIDDTVIYKGVSVPVRSGSYPDAVNVSRILEDYVTTYMFEDEDSGWTYLGGNEFDFYQIVRGEEIYRRTFYFFNDWTQYFGENLHFNSHSLNRPIQGYFTDYMNIPLCVYNNGDGTTYYVRYTFKDGTETVADLGAPTYPYGVQSIYVEDDIEDIKIYNSKDYPLFHYKWRCGDGAFYYLNENGAWDTFLIEGNIYKYDNYERDEYTLNKTTNYSDSWQKKVNRVNTTTTYECSTGWMNYESANKLTEHLLSSPVVYFEYIPESHYKSMYNRGTVAVIITNTQAEHKCFRNGKKLVRYNITFEESNTKTRRGQ